MIIFKLDSYYIPADFLSNSSNSFKNSVLFLSSTFNSIESSLAL